MRFKPSQPKILEADLMPLIDMTFLLITFFMLVINFAKAEVDDSVQLPSSEMARTPEESQNDIIILQLTAEHQVILQGDEFPLADLRENLNVVKGFRQQFNNRTADQTEIIIRGDHAAHGGRIREMISVCQELGYSKFSFRAKQEVLRN